MLHNYNRVYAARIIVGFIAASIALEVPVLLWSSLVVASVVRDSFEWVTQTGSHAGRMFFRVSMHI